MKAAIYARISQDRNGDHLGVQRQVQDCTALAEQRGWAIVGTYIDNDISAYSGKRRPDYRRLLDDIRAGEVTAVIAWHQDRLHRRPVELEEFIEVVEAARCRVETVRAGEVDLATASGRMVARLLGATARYESEHKSDRAKRKHLELADNGQRPGGPRPYGFTIDRKLIPEEAAIIREASRRLLAGESLRTVAVDLNRRGIPAAKGGTWSGQPLKQILINPRNAGLRALGTRIVGPAQWEAILDASEFKRLHAFLTDPSRRLNRTARSYLLSGLLYCSLCGTRIISRPTHGQPGYACATGPSMKGCGHLAFYAEPVEEFISEAVLQRLDTPELARAINQQPDADREAADLGIAIEEDEIQLEELAGMWASKEMELRPYRTAERIITDRLNAHRSRFAKLAKRSPILSLLGQGDELRKRWPDLNLDQRRAIISAVLSRVNVKRAAHGNRFDPSRFEPVWKV